MRRLTTRAAAALALGLATYAPQVRAQTTFASTNDPSATIRLEFAADHRAVVTIVRAARAPRALPISGAVALRDLATGIAHPAEAIESEVSKDGLLVSTRVVFTGVETSVTLFDLLDVARQQEHLYFTKIRIADTDDLAGAFGAGSR